MSDDEFDGVDGGMYMMDLIESAPETVSLIHSIWDGFIFQSFVSFCPEKATPTNLSKEEVKKMLDPDVVKWDEFHTQLLECIFNNRARNKSNATSLSKTYTDTKFKHQHDLARDLPPFLCGASHSQARTDQWISGIDALAAEFARKLEDVIVKGGGDMMKEIEKILDCDWQLKSTSHKETVYYIAGFVLKTINNRSKDKKDKRKHLFAQIEKNASTTKELAAAASLPIGKVASTEAVSLYYATEQFYQVMTTIESVYDSMLKEANVAVFGTLMIAEIVHHLSKVDLGFSQFMPGADEDEMEEVIQTIIDSYTNLRGKDFARKRNAQQGASHTETTRATLGSIDYINNLKKLKRDKTATATTTTKKKKNQGATKSKQFDNNTHADGDSETSRTTNETAVVHVNNASQPKDDIDNMIVNDLKAELRKLGLPVSGLKAVLQERLRAGRATPNVGGNNNTNGNEINAEVGDEEVPDDILAEMALDMHLDHE